MSKDQLIGEKLWSAFEQAAVGVALVTLDGRFVRANPEFCRFTGYNQAQLKRTTFQSITHPDDLPTELESLLRLLDGRLASYRVEKRTLRPDGSIAWGLLSVAVVRDEVGTPLYFIRVVQDVTEQKLVEEALYQVAAIVDYSRDAILATDLDGKITRWNNGASRLYDYSEAEVTGRSITMLVPEDRADEIPYLRARVLNGETIEHYETLRRRKDGSEIAVALTMRPLRDITGKAVGISIVARDITDQKRVQDELARAQERYAAVCEGVSDFVSVQNLRGAYLFASPSCSTLLGFSPQELVGTQAISYVHENDIANVTFTNQRFLAGSDETMQLRYHMRRKDGKYVWLESTIRPVPGTFGRKREIVSIARDVTGEQESRTGPLALRRPGEQPSNHDEVTGLHNRRSIEEYLSARLGSRRASSFPVGCVVLEIDGFKEVNELHGEAVGSEVLKLAAGAIANSCRTEDFLGRYEADRFVIVLPNTDALGTLKVGEKLVRNIESAPWSNVGFEQGLTASVGATCIVQNSGLTFHELWDILDLQLFRANEAGGNCMIMDAREAARLSFGGGESYATKT